MKSYLCFVFLVDLRCRICAKYLTTKDAIGICSKDDNVMEKMMACIPILVSAAVQDREKLFY